MSPSDVVLLPPIGLDKYFWDSLDTGSGRRIAIEYPGHGSTALNGEFPSLEDIADNVAAGLSSPIDVIGVSMGGMIAQQLALRHSDLVRSLVLIATTGRTNREVMVERADRASKAEWPGVVEETIERWFTPATRARLPLSAGVAYVADTLERLDRRAWRGGWLAMASHDVDAALHKIDMPVTCIAGDADVSAPVEALAQIARRVRTGRLAVVPGSHMIPLESPGVISGLLAEHREWTNE